MTSFGLNVERVKKEPVPLSAGEQLMAALKARLPDKTVALATPDMPGIVICHKGKALGLKLLPRGDCLSHAQTQAVIALRDAGMRVETARALDQALALVVEMGVPLKPDAAHELKAVFRQQTRRRP